MAYNLIDMEAGTNTEKRMSRMKIAAWFYMLSLPFVLLGIFIGSHLEYKTAIAVSLIALLASLAVYYTKNKVALIVPFVQTLAIGVLISSFYTFIGQDINYLILIIVNFSLIILTGLIILITDKIAKKSLFYSKIYILIILFIIIMAYLFKKNLLLYPFILFSLILLLFITIGVNLIATDKVKSIHSGVILSYALGYILIFLVILIVISEGEIIDADLLTPPDRKNKPRKSKFNKPLN